jgi:hypothetical protein
MEVSGQLHAPQTLPQEGDPSDTHWIGGWLGLRAGLDAVKMRKKNPSSYRESNSGLPTRSPVALLSELFRIKQELSNSLTNQPYGKEIHGRSDPPTAW